jgi:hypothetical protein
MTELVRGDKLRFRRNVYDSKCGESAPVHFRKRDIHPADAFQFTEIELLKLTQELLAYSVASMTMGAVDFAHHLPIPFPFVSQPNKAHNRAKILR